MDAVVRMRAMVNGFQLSQALSVAATLGLSDLLSDGPRTVEELAEATGCHERSLFRLLRALASVGVYERGADGRFASTELGDVLRTDAPQSVAAWARQVGRPYYLQAWAALEHSVRTGENAFPVVHGCSVWEYRGRHPDERIVFDRAMNEIASGVPAAAAGAYDFGRFATLLDVGGGRGGMLAAILTRYPSMRGILFDQPDVVSGAVEVLEPAGVADRCQVVGGSFFDRVPEGADACLLKSVIHDWADDESVAILSACRRALAPGGTVLLIEQLLERGDDPARTAFSDLNMLVAPGGQERDLAEYGTLLAAAGFRLERAVPTRGQFFVIEATAE